RGKQRKRHRTQRQQRNSQHEQQPDDVADRLPEGHGKTQTEEQSRNHHRRQETGKPAPPPAPEEEPQPARPPTWFAHKSCSTSSRVAMRGVFAGAAGSSAQYNTACIPSRLGPSKSSATLSPTKRAASGGVSRRLSASR